jgi:phospholipase C
MLDALTANPEVWSKTVFFYVFDENDGFFDHMVPPTPPRSQAEGISTVGTTNELFTGSASYPTSRYTSGPYGLGVRVPMIVISPWSKGGFVDSEVFDHTSLIRFIERRFGSQYKGIASPNITPWRRAVAGDLTSAFNFASPNAAVVALPSTASYVPPDQNRHPDYVPKPPATQQLPQQEPGTRPARALPYQLYVDGQVGASGILLSFRNSGKAAAVFQVRSADGLTGPWTYTVGAGDQTSGSFGANSAGLYGLSAHGPNGFLRAFAGSLASGSVNISVNTIYDTRSEAIALVIQNLGSSPANASIFDAYSGTIYSQLIQPHGSATFVRQLQATFGWYDLTVQVASDRTFRRQLAGHIETGNDSMTDPAIATAVPQAAVVA